MFKIRNLFFVVLVLILSSAGIMAQESVPVYRLYNNTSGEHLYTADKGEYDILVSNHGWSGENAEWVAPSSGEAVYRLYNPHTSDHLFTTDEGEKDILTAQHGWQADNNGNPLFYSGGEIPIYRLYQPSSGRHLLSSSEYEYNVLGTQGWRQEGIKLYALESTKPNTPAAVLTLNLSLDYGDPNDPDLNLKNEAYTINVDYDYHMLDVGRPILECNSDANAVVRIPNTLQEGTYLLDLQRKFPFMIGEFEITQDEVGKNVTKNLKMFWQD